MRWRLCNGDYSETEPMSSRCEWKSLCGRKLPFYVRAKIGTPFALAGLWET